MNNDAQLAQKQYFSHMRLNRLLLFVSLFLLVTACSEKEQNQLIGKWKVSEIKSNNQLIYTTDPAEREKIVERVIAEQKTKLPESAWGELDMMRDFFREKLKNSGETTLTINKDKTYSSRTYGAGSPMTEKGKWSVDEQKHLLTLKSSSVQKFRFSFKKDNLILETDDNGEIMKLEFRRL